METDRDRSLGLRAPGIATLLVLTGLAAFVLQSVLVGGQRSDVSKTSREAAGSAAATAKTAAKAKAKHAAAGVPLFFVQNAGQVDRNVEAYVQGTHASEFFTHSGVTFAFDRAAIRGAATAATGTTKHVALKLDFLGGRPVKPSATGRLTGIENFFVGPKSKWHTGVPTSNGLVYRNVWPGIDVQFKGTGKKLEYVFLVHPGASPSDIALAYKGSTGLSLAGGALQVKTSLGTMTDDAPVAYQQLGTRQIPVKSGYDLRGAGRYGFSVGSYDRAKTLVIDPAVLLYSSYLGGAGNESNNLSPSGIAVGNDGSIYVSGSTASPTFPATAGAYDSTNPKPTSSIPLGFVAKLNPAGTALVYSTYIGGTTNGGQSSIGQGVGGIAVDAAGDLWATATTNTSNFPTTAGAFLTSIPPPINGNLPTVGSTITDVFELNPSGSTLDWSTYFFGVLSGSSSGNTTAPVLAVDGGGNVFIAGQTHVASLPVTAGAFQTTYAGTGTSTNGFVTEIAAGGGSLVYSTFLHGSGTQDIVNDIKIDASGDAYVTGRTGSTNWPTTAGALQTTLSSTQSAFVTELNPTGTGLVYSTYLGDPTGGTVGNGLALASDGSTWIVGSASGTSFPMVNPFQPSSGGGTDAFVAHLNPTGTALLASSYLGGSAGDQGEDVAIGSHGIYVDGITTSKDFPGVTGSFQATCTCSGQGGFAAKLTPDGTGLVSATYTSGVTNSAQVLIGAGNSLRLNSADDVYMTGSTGSGFPITASALQTTYGGGSYDAFIQVLTFEPTTITSQASPGVAPGTAISDVATLTNGNSPTGTITFNLYGPGDTTCATPLATSTATVSGNGSYASQPYVPTLSGTYQWVATYGGDGAIVNPPTVPAHPCADPAEAVVVSGGISSANVSITNSASTSATTGNPLTYTLTVGNAGPSAASDVTVTDPLPSGVTFVSATPSAGTCSQTSGTVTCWLGSVSVGAAPTVAIVVTPTATGPLSNTATVAAVESDPDTSSNSATASSTVGTPSADISVTNSGAPNPVALGTQATFTIAVTNNGPQIANGVSLIDNVPSGSTYSSNSTTNGTCLQASGVLTCTIGSLNPGQVATVTLKVVVTAIGTGTLSDTATATTTTSDPDNTNNSGVGSIGIGKANPTLSATASAGVPIGGSVTDTATLASGQSTPSGTITYNLYGPSDPTCAAAAVFTTTKPVNGNGTYASAAFTTTSIATTGLGTYHWIASYGGDANNNAVTAACGATNESVTVVKASPTVTTQASAGVAPGGSISDTATIASGFAPGGTITFNLYGPADQTCAQAPVATSQGTVAGNGPYPSSPFTADTPGLYHWVASYTGDSNNNATAGTCGAANQSVTVGAVTTLQTLASQGIAFGSGGSLTVTGTLAGATNPTGTISFKLYGPNDSTCSSATAASTSSPVTANGPYTSPPFTPTVAGTYQWIVAYSGDTNNTAATGSCSDPNERVIVRPAGAPATCGSTGVLAGNGLSCTYSTPGSDVFTAPAGLTGTTITVTGAQGGAATNAGGAGGRAQGNLAVTGGQILQVDVGGVGGAASATGGGAGGVGGSDSGVAGRVTDGGGGAGGTQGATNNAGGGGGSSDVRNGNSTDCAADSCPLSSRVLVGGGGGGSGATGTNGIGGAAGTGGGATGGNGANANGPNTGVGGSGGTQSAAGAGGTSASNARAGAAGNGGSGGAGGAGNGLGAGLIGGAGGGGGGGLFGGGGGSGGGTTAAAGAGAGGAGGSGFFSTAAALTGGSTTSAVNTSGNGSVVISWLAPATISTQASAGITIGAGSLTDVATLANGVSPTGTVTFDLYGPSDATCSSAPVATSTGSVSGNGQYTSAPYTPTVPGTYRWIATYTGDAANQPFTGTCGAANETVTVSEAVPGLSTQASGSVPAGGSISDTATLVAGNNPTGTITFKLYAVSDTTCSTALATSTASVSGNGSYNSNPYAALTVGTYRWIASYSGDANNAAVSAACRPGTTVPVSTQSMNQVTMAHAQITFPVSCPAGSLAVGGGSYLRNASNPATIPTNGLVLFGTLPADGSGNAVSNGSTNPTTWTSISGYSGVAETGDQSESFAVCATSGGPSSTGVVTATTTGANAAQEVSPPTITTATCVSGSRLVGGGAVESTPGQVNNGTTGSNNNGNLKPLASYPSNAAGAMATDGSTNPTSWSAYGSAGLTAATDQITAFAICSTDPGFQPTVTVVSHDDTGPLGQTGTTVTADTVQCTDSELLDGGYRVDETVNGTPGLQPQQGYHMRGSYPSDPSGTEVANGATSPSYWTNLLQAGGQNLGANNQMVMHSLVLCAQDNSESVTVTKATPALSTNASRGVAVGGQISDSATLAGGASPTGSVTFKLYGPNNVSCSGSPAASSVVTVSGNGTYTSSSFSPTIAGSYNWAATYGGDANDNAVSGSCGDPDESVVVTAGGAASLSVSPSSVAGGASVTVSFSGVTNPTAQDWVGVYHQGDPDSSYIDWFWANSCSQTLGGSGVASNACPYSMPGVAGTYEFRLFTNNTVTKLATSNAVTDAGAAAATLAAAPGSVTAGGSTMVSFGGVVNPSSGDWVALYPTGAPNSGYVSFFYTNSCTQNSGGTAVANGSCSFTMPTTPGAYEFRLFSNNSFNLLATSNTVTVTALAAATVMASPDSVSPGGGLSVSWANVPKATGKDWVALYSTAGGAYLDWFYDSTCSQTSGAASGSGSCPYTMPTAPGTYDFVLYANDGNTVIATSSTVTVTGGSITLTVAPESVSASGSRQVLVSWSGVPAATNADWIGLYATGAGDTAYLGFLYDATCTTNAGGTAQSSGSCVFTLPATNGTYEFRLFANNGFGRLATSNTVTVSG